MATAFRDMLVNKACMSLSSFFYITNAAILEGALVEHSRTNSAHGARWWPISHIHAIGHASAQHNHTLSMRVINALEAHWSNYAESSC